MYLSTDGRSQATNPSSKQCLESSNQRPSPSASPSAPVPAVSWSAQRQPHVFLHTLHCSRPRRPQTVVECPWSCSRYALQDILQASGLLACIALQLDQDSSPVVGPPLAASPGGGCLFTLPRGFCPTGPRGMHGKKIDRSDHSCAPPSPAYLNYSNLVSSHLSATPGLCRPSVQCISYIHALVTSAIAILSPVPRLQGLVVRSDSSTLTNRTPVLAAAPLRTSQRKEPRPASTLRPHFSRWRVFALPPSRLTHIAQYPRCATTESRPSADRIRAPRASRLPVTASTIRLSNPPGVAYLAKPRKKKTPQRRDPESSPADRTPRACPSSPLGELKITRRSGPFLSPHTVHLNSSPSFFLPHTHS